MPQQDFIYIPKTRVDSGLPSAESLAVGELWTNQTDRTIGTKTESGDVVVLSGIHQDQADLLYAALTGATFTGDVTAPAFHGTADDAAKLETPRNIDGVAFDGTADINHYAQNTETADTADRTLTLTGTFAYVVGAVLYVRLDNGNSAAQTTINVNGLGAKAVKLKGEALGPVEPMTTIQLVYNGTEFEVVGGIGGITVGDYYSKAEMDAKFLPIVSPVAKGTMRVLRLDDSDAQTLVENYNNAVSTSSSGTSIIDAYTKEEADALFAKIMNPTIVDEITIIDDTEVTE